MGTDLPLDMPSNPKVNAAHSSLKLQLLKAITACLGRFGTAGPSQDFFGPFMVRVLTTLSGCAKIQHYLTRTRGKYAQFSRSRVTNILLDFIILEPGILFRGADKRTCRPKSPLSPTGLN